MAYQIEFFPVADREHLAQDGACYMCGAASYRPVLRVGNTQFHLRDLDLVECDRCHSLYFRGEDTVLGYDFNGFEKDYWYNYVQNGAGITAMLSPLLGIEGLKGGSLLDVGCGFGFVPHFWRTMGYGDAVGLETSEYGRIGAALLPQEIIHSYYADAAAISGRKFDFVFSSEVIEHVPDPKAFVLEIAQALDDDGILVLTTPSADAIAPDCPPEVMSAVLSPGFHYFIASQAALEALVKDCGFAHVRVENTGERLFLWASRKPLPATTGEFADWDIYFRYLELLSGNANPHVSGGALYRLLKDAVNLGKFDQADKVFDRFSQLALETYGIDFTNPGASAARRATRELQNWKTWPSWLGCGFLFVALYLKQQEADPVLIRENLEAAIETMLVEVDLGAQFAQEAAYFMPYAEQELESVSAVIKAHADEHDVPAKKIRIVRPYKPDPGDRDICLFVSYAPDGILRPGTLDYVTSLKASGIDVILCVAVEDLSAPLAKASNPAAVDAVLWRENGGYDFAVWAAVLALMPDLWRAKRLFIVNDSVFVIKKALSKAIDRIRCSSADFIGMTESFAHAHHVQSYFFVLQKAALDSSIIRSFWREVRTLATKEDVINAYELTFLERVKKDPRLSHEILFSYARLFPAADPEEFRDVNPTHSLWEPLVRNGFPFIKIELVQRNPLLLDIDHLPDVARKHGANLSLMKAHLDAMPGHRGGPAYGKWPAVRRLIGEERFHALRRFLRERRLKSRGK